MINKRTYYIREDGSINLPGPNEWKTSATGRSIQYSSYNDVSGEHWYTLVHPTTGITANQILAMAEIVKQDLGLTP